MFVAETVKARMPRINSWAPLIRLRSEVVRAVHQVSAKRDDRKIYSTGGGHEGGQAASLKETSIGIPVVLANNSITNSIHKTCTLTSRGLCAYSDSDKLSLDACPNQP